MHARHARALLALILSASASISLAACSSASGGSSSAPATAENPVNHEASAADVAATRSSAPIAAGSAVLYVNGLGCPLCASNIDKQLHRVEGVERVTVDLSLGKVDVAFASGAARPSPAVLGDAVEDAGFTLVKIEPATAGGGR